MQKLGINSLASYAIVNHFGFIETPYRIVGLINFKDAQGGIVKFPESKWHFGIFKAFVHDPHYFLTEQELSSKEKDSIRMNLDNRQRDLFDMFVGKVFEVKYADGSKHYFKNGFEQFDFSGKADYVQASDAIDQVVSDFITFLTADEEDAFKVAPASTELTDDNRFKEEYVIVRDKSEYPHVLRQDSIEIGDEIFSRLACIQLSCSSASCTSSSRRRVSFVLSTLILRISLTPMNTGFLSTMTTALGEMLTWHSVKA